MTRFSSPIVASFVLMAGAGCLEEEPSDRLSSPFDGGGGAVGQPQTCPTCSIDAGVLVSAAVAATACNTLDPGACAGHAGCTPVLGLAYDAVRYCRGETELPVYCQSSAVECGFGPIRVVDAVGQRWLLGNKCVPPGYKAAPTEVHPIEWIEDYTVCPSASLQTRCAQLNESTCASNPGCFAQLGTQLNERGKCKEGSEHFVACVQNTTCNRVLTYARDSTGTTWELVSSCLPSGYTALPLSSVAAHTSWPSCF